MGGARSVDRGWGWVCRRRSWAVCVRGDVVVVRDNRTSNPPDSVLYALIADIAFFLVSCRRNLCPFKHIPNLVTALISGQHCPETETTADAVAGSHGLVCTLRGGSRL